MAGQVNTDTEFEVAALRQRRRPRKDMVNGRKHYVCADEKGRAVVGPEVGKRRNRGVFRRRLQSPVGHETPDLSGQPERMTVNIPRFDIPPIQFVKAPDHRTPSRPQGRWSRFKKWAEGYFYDQEWHRAIQHTAVDVLVWSLTVGFSAMALKAAYWVVML